MVTILYRKHRCTSGMNALKVVVRLLREGGNRHRKLMKTSMKSGNRWLASHMQLFEGLFVFFPFIQNATSTEEGYLYTWETLHTRYEKEGYELLAP